ncbi:MAG TPA: M48 family metallopeptidase [Actinomycetota bacterium]
MIPRRTLAVGAAVALLLLWWASGLDRSPVPADRFFSQAEIARAGAYRTPLYAATALRLTLDLGLLAVLAFTPAGAWLGRLRGSRWIRGAALAIGAIVLLRFLVRLPISFWAGYVHEHSWGFSTQTVWGWLGDAGRSVGLALAVSTPAYVGAVWAARRWPRRWPALLVPATAALILLGSFVWPVVVEPLFNRFEPLRRPAAERFEALAHRAGVPVDAVLVADASRRTRKENAYVSGFGGTKRLVLYDTLLRSVSPEEAEVVVAHELGHRRRGHVLRGTLVGAVAGAGAILLIALLARTRWLRRAGGATGPDDPRMLPALLLGISLLSLAALPPSNLLSRSFEEEADRIALALTRDRQAYEAAHRGLALRNLSDLDPGPVAFRFLATHPAAPERIAYALEP